MTRRFFYVAATVLVMSAVSSGADITGNWTASFDTQVGKQNDTYTFKAEGNKLTGAAKSDNGNVQITKALLTGTTCRSSRT